jgi:hypothetical protein
MKKYLIASMVAVVAFAFAAFAAQLNVNAGPLQAGQDNNLKCGDDAVVTYATSNNTTGHWIDKIHVQFDTKCEDNWVILNGFGPEANNQILSLVSEEPIDAAGKVTFDIANGHTYVADLINVQVLVKNSLVTGTFEYPGFEASGNPIQVRSTTP